MNHHTHWTVLRRFLGLAATASLTAAASAQIHEGDIGLNVVSDQIQTGVWDSSAFTEQRVFGAIFGDSSIFNFTTNPGFDCPGGTFPASTTVGFNIRAALGEWTGDGFAATDKTITINFSTLQVPTAEGFVEGFGLATNSSGRWHRHLGFTLNNATQQESGIFLLELELWHESSTIDTSKPFFIVFSFNENSATHEAAIAWVEQSLSAAAATLVALEANLGTVTQGGLDELQEADSDYLVVRSQFGFTAQEANVMQITVGAETELIDAMTLDLAIKGRLNNPGGNARVSLRNWSNNAFQQVHQYTLGTAEITETIQGLVAANRIRAGDGRIDMRIRIGVLATFSANGFDTRLDHVQIIVAGK